MFKDPKFIAAVVTILAGIGAYFGLEIPEDIIGGAIAVILATIYGKTAVKTVQAKMAKKKEKGDA